MITITQLDTTWNVASDVQKIMSAIEDGKTNKSQLRVVYVGEQHVLLYDQQRRAAVLKELRKSHQFFFTVIERGLDADPTGVPNVIWENSRMDANFLQRNNNTLNQIEDAVKDSHTTTNPVLVFLFGERHETNLGTNSHTAIQKLLVDRLGGWRREKIPILENVTEVLWTSVPSIDTVISGEMTNANWNRMVKVEPGNLLGCVEYDRNHIDHNMLLAEKCLIKQKFHVNIAPEKEMFRGSYWKLYVRHTSKKDTLFQNIVEGGDRDFTLTSLNPSHMLKAVFQGPR